MKNLTAKTRIALGQTAFLAGLLLLAIWALIPDQTGAIRQSRATLAEAIAHNSTTLSTKADIRRLEATLRLMVERNDEIVSAAVRRAEGNAVATVGEHEKHWSQVAGEYSTDSQVQVPIWVGRQKWGKVEIRFRPVAESGWMGIVSNAYFQLFCFIVLSNFLVSYFYLGEMLNHPDSRRSKV